MILIDQVINIQLNVYFVLLNWSLLGLSVIKNYITCNLRIIANFKRLKWYLFNSVRVIQKYNKISAHIVTWSLFIFISWYTHMYILADVFFSFFLSRLSCVYICFFDLSAILGSVSHCWIRRVLSPFFLSIVHHFIKEKKILHFSLHCSF